MINSEWVSRWLIRSALLGVSVVIVHVGGKALFSRAPLSIPTAHADLAKTPGSIHAEGRVVTYPNGSVVLGTEVGGRLLAIHFVEGDTVKKGALVAEFDASEQRAALSEAAARAHAASVSINFLKTETARSKQLLEARAVTSSSLDKTRHELDSATAQRGIAGAEYGRIMAAVAKAKVSSPLDGIILERFAEPGETLPPGARLVTIVDPNRMRIEAEVDEFDAPNVKLGMPVKITAEGHARSWIGKVEEVPAAVTSRRLKPQDPGRTTDSHVLLVKVAIADMAGLKFGQRVEISIDATTIATEPTKTDGTKIATDTTMTATEATKTATDTPKPATDTPKSAPPRRKRATSGAKVRK